MDLLRVRIVLEGCLKSLKFSPMLGRNLFIPGSSYIFIRACNFFCVLQISAERTTALRRVCYQNLVLPLAATLDGHLISGNAPVHWALPIT